MYVILNHIFTAHGYTVIHFFSFLQASAQVFYWILDVNDNFPYFPSQYYNVTVGEVCDCIVLFVVRNNV